MDSSDEEVLLVSVLLSFVIMSSKSKEKSLGRGFGKYLKRE